MLSAYVHTDKDYIINTIDRIIRINNYEPILLIRKRNKKPATFALREVETFSPFYHFQTLEVIDGKFDAASSKLLSVGASNEMPRVHEYHSIPSKQRLHWHKDGLESIQIREYILNLIRWKAISSNISSKRLSTPRGVRPTCDFSL